MTTALEIRRREAALANKARRERLRQSKITGSLFHGVGSFAGGALFSVTEVAGIPGAINYAAGTVGIVLAATGRGRPGGAADALANGLMGMGTGQLAQVGKDTFGGALLGETLFGSLFED